MKVCTTCHQNKDLSEYNKNRHKKDGLSNICRECNKEHSKRFYWEHRDHQLLVIGKRNKERKARIRKYVDDYLSEHPCVDCGQSDIRVLQFDHVNGDKKMQIGWAAKRGMKISLIQAEMAKCEVRCANCHIIRHWEERRNVAQLVE